jgi:hypothetical protein
MTLGNAAAAHVRLIVWRLIAAQDLNEQGERACDGFLGLFWRLPPSAARLKKQCT